MSHPATRVRGVTFVQNVGTPQETSHTKSSVPMLRRRIDPTSTTPEAMAREFNLALEDIHQATLGARSIPFGGPVVVFEGVSFTSGTDVTIAHRLKSAKAILLAVAHPMGLTSGVPLAWVISVDDTNVVLRPLGTFTADVIMGVSP